MTARIDSPNNVNDFATLTALRKDARAQSPEALREAARQFESLFTRMMLESMRAASMGDPLFGSDSADFYQGMFDDQLAVELSKGRGLGLADMLIEQLTRAGMSGAAQAGSPQAPDLSSNSGSSRETPVTALPPGATANWQPQTRAEFIAGLWPHAEEAGRSLGVDPHVLLAHAALETGWGKSFPTASDGRVSYNLFGIKAAGGWRGEAVGAQTVEFDDGIASRRIERFRAYDSPAESFKDYVQLLSGSGRYREVIGTGSDARAFATALQRGGYATDPDYANKLVAVAARLGVVATPANSALKVAASRPIASLEPFVRSEG
jgi:peptidoglycan hydrolase FlgJ